MTTTETPTETVHTGHRVVLATNDCECHCRVLPRGHLLSHCQPDLVKEP